MRYLGSEKIRCVKCNAMLDVPLYINGDEKKYGFKFCHQCGASLFDVPLTADIIPADARTKIIDYLYEFNTRADIKIESMADDIISILTDSLK